MGIFSLVGILAFLCFKIALIERQQVRILSRLGLIISWLSEAPSRIAFFTNGSINEVRKMNLKDSQQLPMTIAATDKFGNPTGSFDQAPAWSVVDATLGALQVADDALSATFVPSGKLGTTQVQVAAMADGKSIAGSLDISVVAGDAVAVVIQPGAPVDVPAPTPSA